MQAERDPLYLIQRSEAFGRQSQEICVGIQQEGGLTIEELPKPKRGEKPRQPLLHGKTVAATLRVYPVELGCVACKTGVEDFRDHLHGIIGDLQA